MHLCILWDHCQRARGATLLALEYVFATPVVVVAVQAEQQAAKARHELAQALQVELQLQASQAAERRLSLELAAAQQALSSSDGQVQELLDANTLLESQVQLQQEAHGGATGCLCMR